MRFPTLSTCCALAVLSVGACSGDATAPASPTGAEPSASSSQMYVTISGPTEVATRWTCTWNVYVSGGTPPYSYQWYYGGMVQVDAAYNYWQGYASVGGNVALDVYVTDALGATSWGHLVIQSSSEGPFCME